MQPFHARKQSLMPMWRQQEKVKVIHKPRWSAHLCAVAGAVRIQMAGSQPQAHETKKSLSKHRSKQTLPRFKAFAESRKEEMSKGNAIKISPISSTGDVKVNPGSRTWKDSCGVCVTNP